MIEIDDREAGVVVITDLETEHSTDGGIVRSLDQATLRVGKREVIAVVGESGSGKSTLGMAVGRLLAQNSRITGGTIVVDGVDVAQCDEAGLRGLRKHSLGYIFQNPVAALNPTLRIRRQLNLILGRSASREELRALLDTVGLAGDSERVLRAFPHELSGGMAQRVAIAMALMRRPSILIADEPTAAVDATARLQILDLLVSQCRDNKCALIVLTHDLHAALTHADRVAVMYGGRIVESGPARQVLSNPTHPYTRALVDALPGDEAPNEELRTVPGSPPVLMASAVGCAFAPRCPSAIAECSTARPDFIEVDGHALCCHLDRRPREPLSRDVRRSAPGTPQTERLVGTKHKQREGA